MLCLLDDDAQFGLWIEKYSTCPKKGIPCLKCGSTFTNESLVIVLVISLSPLPVNSTSEKRRKKNKSFFGRMICLNFLYYLPPFKSYFGKGYTSMPIAFSPIPTWYTNLFLLLWSWLPLQVPFYNLLSSSGRPWFLLAERRNPGCWARRE